MYKFSPAEKMKILKGIGAYLFLFATFLGIFYYFSYNAWVCCKPISLMFVIFKTVLFIILYVLINHLLIRKVVGVKTVIIIETLLILTLFTLFRCYGILWNLHN